MFQVKVWALETVKFWKSKGPCLTLETPAYRFQTNIKTTFWSNSTKEKEKKATNAILLHKLMPQCLLFYVAESAILTCCQFSKSTLTELLILFRKSITCKLVTADRNNPIKTHKKKMEYGIATYMSKVFPEWLSYSWVMDSLTDSTLISIWKRKKLVLQKIMKTSLSKGSLKMILMQIKVIGLKY